MDEYRPERFGGGRYILDVYKMIQNLVPELKPLLTERISLMRYLANQSERVGRQAIADAIHLSERHTRSLIQILREEDLVEVDRSGVQLTPKGNALLEHVNDWMNHTSDLSLDYLEASLRNALGINEVHLVAGDSRKDGQVFEEMSLRVQGLLNELLPDNYPSTIAVTGGTTLAEISKYFTPAYKQGKELTFVPSRGGFPGNFDIQSNSVSGLMAKQSQAAYVPLFIPDNLTEAASQFMMEEPSIKRAIDLGRSADCLILSVGTASVMAERREISEDQAAVIQESQAVGEAFGAFYDRHGQIVMRYPRIGLKIEDINQIPNLLAVVGGAEKAEAVKAFFKLVPHRGILVCDEALAKQVLNG